jgi:hypothetical protein
MESNIVDLIQIENRGLLSETSENRRQGKDGKTLAKVQKIQSEWRKMLGCTITQSGDCA